MTSAPFFVTARIAGEVAVAAPADVLAEADVLWVTVTVGAGDGELPPHAVSATATADAPTNRPAPRAALRARRPDVMGVHLVCRRAADANLRAGIWVLHLARQRVPACEAVTNREEESGHDRGSAGSARQ
ncbi:MAG TPA: hypothetical protein VMA32_05480 [Streptosporangiaceae bacterium]|nr:hypothetical protein [Streptosporangiaceae bacterium]